MKSIHNSRINKKCLVIRGAGFIGSHAAKELLKHEVEEIFVFVGFSRGKIYAGEAPIVNGDGSQSYDFIAAEDVARCNISAVISNFTDQFYNVGSVILTNICSLCELILELFDSNLEVIYNPYSSDNVRRLVQNRIGCTKKAHAGLGFTHKLNLSKRL